MKTKIFVTAQFESIHCWPAAVEEVSFLQYPHRHMFHVRVEWEVDHDDRAREFLMEKRRVVDAAKDLEKEDKVLNWSCEMWAKALLNRLNANSVEVSEDGENGAVVTR